MIPHAYPATSATSGHLRPNFKKNHSSKLVQFLRCSIYGEKMSFGFFLSFLFLALIWALKNHFLQIPFNLFIFSKKYDFPKIWSLFSAHIRAANITESENLFSPHICYTTQIAPILKSVFFWNSAGGGRDGRICMRDHSTGWFGTLW